MTEFGNQLLVEVNNSVTSPVTLPNTLVVLFTKVCAASHV